MNREANIGEIIVCVDPRWDTTLGESYMVIDKRIGLTFTYYSIIDDSGKLQENLYMSKNFLPIEEYKKAVAIK